MQASPPTLARWRLAENHHIHITTNDTPKVPTMLLAGMI
jgi:hypothetical protein